MKAHRYSSKVAFDPVEVFHLEVIPLSGLGNLIPLLLHLVTLFTLTKGDE